MGKQFELDFSFKIKHDTVEVRHPICKIHNDIQI